MSIWGKRVDDLVTPKPRAADAPAPVWVQARPIALGILIAAAVIFTLWRVAQPSETDCLIQRAEVATAERVIVESGCLNR